MNDSYVIKDSGNRQAFAGGMVRDVTTGKTNYSLALDGPMFKRWAIHMTKGAIKYAARNWMLAQGDEEYERFRESALRHFLQWFDGDSDEDHAAAVFFNINGAEYIKVQNRKQAGQPLWGDLFANARQAVAQEQTRVAKAKVEAQIKESLGAADKFAETREGRWE